MTPTPPRRRWFQFGLTIAILVVMLPFVYSGIESFRFYYRRDVVRYPDTGYRLPDLAEIDSIQIAWWNSSIKLQDEGVEIPDRCWANVLAAISPSERYCEDRKILALGGLVVTEKNGQKTIVDIFWSGPRLVPFAAGSDRESIHFYRGGDFERLKQAMNEAFYEAARIKDVPWPVSHSPQE